MRAWLISIVLALVPLDAGGPTPASDGPRFDGDKLLQPVGYDMWPVVGASLGLSVLATRRGQRSRHVPSRLRQPDGVRDVQGHREVSQRHDFRPRAA